MKPKRNFDNKDGEMVLDKIRVCNGGMRDFTDGISPVKSNQSWAFAASWGSMMNQQSQQLGYAVPLVHDVSEQLHFL